MPIGEVSTMSVTFRRLGGPIIRTCCRSLTTSESGTPSGPIARHAASHLWRRLISVSKETRRLDESWCLQVCAAWKMALHSFTSPAPPLLTSETRLRRASSAQASV
eukprot:10923576-Alexandrium_andersonii.AAC.1